MGQDDMRGTAKLVLLFVAATFAALPLRSQTPAPPKLSFDVISIKPGAPLSRAGTIGGGTRGNRSRWFLRPCACCCKGRGFTGTGRFL